MKILAWIVGVPVVGFLLFMTIGLLAPEQPLDERACDMAMYFAGRRIEAETGGKVRIRTCDDIARAGPNSWRASGTYAFPTALTIDLTWRAKIYGPFDGDQWRLCELEVNGEEAFRLGSLIVCD